VAACAPNCHATNAPLRSSRSAESSPRADRTQVEMTPYVR
jgi:hypothetical protein